MPAPTVLTTRAELATWRARVGESLLALVPTMGALHEGHQRLITSAREAADLVVVSIFVNPLQFGPAEDFDRYPRTLQADLDLCAELGADAVFAPSQQEMYPQRYAITVSAGRMGTILEGATRPGHFDGVLTVVLKLFNLIRPDLAFFGLKDIQQYAMIHRMVTDLNLDVGVRGVEIVRDADGLALSSRNSYLNRSEREAALALSRALRAADEEAVAGARGNAGAVKAAAESVLTDAVRHHPEIDPDYLELVDFDTFTPLSPNAHLAARAVLAVAAYAGGTRLIDNILLGDGWDSLG